MFITPAFAQAGGAADGINPLLQLAPFIAVIGIMYLLIWRPQQKRMKEHRDMIESIRRGHTVVTAGGIIGKVAKVRDGEIDVDIAPNVRIAVVKGTITEVRAKGEPVRSGGDGDDEDDGGDGGGKDKPKGKPQIRAAAIHTAKKTGSLPPEVMRGKNGAADS